MIINFAQAGYKFGELAGIRGRAEQGRRFSFVPRRQKKKRWALGGCHIYFVSDLRELFLCDSRAFRTTPRTFGRTQSNQGGQQLMFPYLWNDCSSYEKKNTRTLFDTVMRFCFWHRQFDGRDIVVFLALLCESRQWMMRTWRCRHAPNTLDLPWKCAVENPQRKTEVSSKRSQREEERERGGTGGRDNWGGRCTSKQILWYCRLVRGIFTFCLCIFGCVLTRQSTLSSINSQRSYNFNPRCYCTKNGSSFGPLSGCFP